MNDKKSLMRYALAYFRAACIVAPAYFFDGYDYLHAFALVALLAYVEATGALMLRVERLEEITDSVSSLGAHQMRNLPERLRMANRGLAKRDEVPKDET